MLLLPETETDRLQCVAFPLVLPQELPITEKAELHATNPYGRTKLFIEQIIADYAAATPGSFSLSPGLVTTLIPSP